MKNGACAGTCVGCKVTGLLVILGALNWGAIAVVGVDVVARALSAYPMAIRVVYGLIGVAGLLKLISCFVSCPGCKK